jgi:glycosyltransferase involved in cell wall biosynthesis
VSAPLVSILIPTWNSARWVVQAVESALAQTHRDIEVIVSDNASTDDTTAYVSQVASRDARVRLLRGEINRGPVANWQRAADEARGEYAGLLFSDDWYEPAFVERALELIGDEVGQVFSATRVVREGEPGGEILRYLPAGSVTGRYPSRLYLEGELTLKDFLLPISPGCALFRARDLQVGLAARLPCYLACGALDHGAGPDLLLGLRAAGAYPEFGYVAEPLVNFRLHGSNLFRHPLVAVAYELTRCDFFDAERPTVIPIRDHMARRIFARVRHARTLARIGYQPQLGLGEIAWMPLVRHAARRARERFGRRRAL